MKYPFRTTFRANSDLYIEDRGHAHEVRRGDPDFETLDAEFGNLLMAGQTAEHDMEGSGWTVVDGFPLLTTLKAIKFERLKVAKLQAEAHGAVKIRDGFVIDANQRAYEDVNGLITRLEETGRDSARFRAADNSYHEVTLADLKAMRLAIICYGEDIYDRKWALEEAIAQASTPAQLEAVNITFADLGA